MTKPLDSDSDVILILVSSIGVVLLFVTFIITFLLIFQKRAYQHQKSFDDMEQNYRQEMLKTQIEVQDSTLNYVSQEIHDNIGQVLSFVKLTLGTVKNAEGPEKQQKIDESRELIAQSITDLRNLSKSMSFQHIAEFGLAKSIQVEVDRVNKNQLMETALSITGDVYSLGEQRELVLFRIFQEAINNSLKYSQAKHLKINLQYSEELFNLTIADDGIGFADLPPEKKGGAGLKNMTSRATLIGAVATINSSPGKGCRIEVSLHPIQKSVYTDGNYSNSLS